METSSPWMNGEAHAVRLKSRPTGIPEQANFSYETSSIAALVGQDELTEGQVLLRIDVLSLDPYMRTRISGRVTYAQGTEVGEVLPGQSICTVIETADPYVKEGSQVLAHTGWVTHAVVLGSAVQPLPERLVKASYALGVQGMPGLTAYAGLAKYGRLQPGETVVVAAATGPVGSMVGQIAKQRGARAVGIASGAEKCRLLVEQLGFDAAIDRLDPSFAEQLKQVCPEGVDVYFETVGGQVFEAVLPLLNRHARIPLCGLVGQWSGTIGEGTSAAELMRITLDRVLSFSGFVVYEIADEFRDDFHREVGDWLRSGNVQALEHLTVGLEHAVQGFIEMLRGDAIGKSLVQVTLGGA